MPYVGKKPADIIATAIDTTTGTFSGVVDADAGITVDNITIDGTEIDLSSGDLTIDVAGDIILDAGGADILFKDDGTTIAEITNSSSDLIIKSSVSDKDMKFQGVDGSSLITALTLDMSEAGDATFNNRAIFSNNVSIGTTSFPSKFTVSNAGTDNVIETANSSNSVRGGMQADTSIVGMGAITDHTLVFRQNNSEVMRHNGSNFLVGTTNNSPAEGTATGTRIGGNGASQFSATGQYTLYVNRVEDGAVIAIASAGTVEGSINVSGSTVSFNAFSGSHWSRLTDNSKPTILRGTIIETIDEMCDWYQVEITIPKTDDEDECKIRNSIALPDGKKVGDTISYTYGGVTYDNVVIEKEENVKHTKCKVSDTSESKSVYGVFLNWDNDDDNVNDMYVTAVGTNLVRINKNVTVSKGDLLVSNGDGTAKVQDDDIIRSKTIGKVLTNIKQETYDDGSYTVPCALYCG